MSNLKTASGGVAPFVARRFGVIIAGYLVGLGLPEEIATRLVMAAAVFGGVVIDVAIAWYLARGAAK